MKTFIAALATFLSITLLDYRVHFCDLRWSDQVWAAVATAVLFWAGVFFGMDREGRK